MTQPLCSKLKKWINNNLNTKQCCKQFSVVPYREFNFQNILRRYQPSAKNSMPIGKRLANSLTKQQVPRFGPVKKIKLNEEGVRKQNKQIQARKKSKGQFVSQFFNQQKRIQHQNQRQNGQNLQKKTLTNFKINLNKKIKSLKPTSTLQESNQKYHAQIQKQKQIQIEQVNSFTQEKLQISINTFQLMEKSNFMNQEQQFQNEQKFNQQLQILQNVNQDLKKKKEQFWKEQQENSHQQQQEKNVQLNCLNQEENKKQIYQIRQENLQIIEDIQDVQQSQVKGEEIMKNQIILKQNLFLSERQDKIEIENTKKQTFHTNIFSSNFINQKQKIIFHRSETQNSLNFANTNYEEPHEKANLHKKGSVEENLNMNKTKRHQKLKDQTIITRSQESHLHLLNKLSLRLLRQKYGQQETIDSLTSKILENQKFYHIQGILQTKNRIVNQLTFTQKKNIISKYLKEQQESFKLRIR